MKVKFFLVIGIGAIVLFAGLCVTQRVEANTSRAGITFTKGQNEAEIQRQEKHNEMMNWKQLPLTSEKQSSVNQEAVGLVFVALSFVVLINNVEKRRREI